MTPRFAGLLAVLVALCGCSAPRPCYSPEADQILYSIYVVRRAQHTGVVVRTEDWPHPDWALLADFPQARYLEFGWGDEEYYQADEETIRMALAAVLWPTPSVMQVIGFAATPEPASDDFVEVRISQAGLRALAASIASSFAGEELQPTGPVELTREGRLRFYHAHGSFYFPRMCNRWTAEQLKVAGCPIRPATVVLAGRVVREARGFAAAGEQRAAVHSPRQNLYGAGVTPADALLNGNIDR